MLHSAEMTIKLLTFKGVIFLLVFDVEVIEKAIPYSLHKDII